MTDLRQDLVDAVGPPPPLDLDRIRRRAGQLQRRPKIVARAATAAAVAVVALLVGLELGDDGDSTVVTNEPAPAPENPAVPTTLDNEILPTVPSTTAPAPRSTSTAPAPAREQRQRMLEDPAGDANESPGSEPDASLDLLALDVAFDGEAVTFVHVVDGMPSTAPPPGATGRHHDWYFRIPGHNLVQVSLETMKRDVVVLVGVIEPGEEFGSDPAQRCVDCDAAFDSDAREVRVRVPVDFLNRVLARSDGGEIRSGVEVGGWEAYTSKTTTTRTYYEERESPHFFTAAPMDSAKRYDVLWTVP